MEKIATAQSDNAGFLNTTVATMCFTAWIIVLVTLLARNEALNWGLPRSAGSSVSRY
ncbi:MAG: hypothetical protein QGF90_14515 [Gammaproteobacteria bacterium]|nr:hypothetical protein [Gammaproteobacteria bacterium]